MIPASIQIAHAFENHEHTICTSLVENHFHEDNVDCDEFHKQLIVFSVIFSSNFDVIPSHFYSITFIDKPQKFKDVYHSEQSSRGPPFFTI